MDRKLASFLVVLAFGTVVCGRHATCSDVEHGAVEGVILAYKFDPGDVVRYRIWQQVTGSRTLPGATSPTPIDIQLTSTIRMRCTKLLPERSMEMSVETESETLKLAGKEARHYDGRKQARVFRIAPSGRMIGPGHGKAGGKAPRRSPLDFGSTESIVLMTLFPERLVLPGGDWVAEIPLPISPSSRLRMSFRLDALRQTPDGLVATISQSLNTPTSAEAKDESDKAQGVQEGQATLTFDVDQGRLISAQGTVKSELRTRWAVPSVPGEETYSGSASAVMTVWLNSKFSVRLLSSADKSSDSSGK